MACLVYATIIMWKNGKSPDEYVMRLYDFVEEFQEKFNEEMSNEDILKLCSK